MRQAQSSGDKVSSPRRKGFARFREMSLFRLRRCFVDKTTSGGSVTFCFAHFNAPNFLEVSLDAVRRHYRDERIIVTDASSVWSEFCAAKSICSRYRAELHPLLNYHRHTGLLNYMFRRIRSPIGIFLDQDCVLLDRLDALLEAVASGTTLVGPADEMRLTHQNLCSVYPKFANRCFRIAPEYIHASLMVVSMPRVRAWAKRRPFHWRDEWGQHPLERYYGFTELIRRNQPEGIMSLKSCHTAYGLGTVYVHAGRPIAYHNWYSGQVYGQSGKMDSAFDADWLRAEAKRFLGDYWDGKVDFKLAPLVRGIGGEAYC
jgi:hypothetical protein